jgi:hypothetical protein
VADMRQVMWMAGRSRKAILGSSVKIVGNPAKNGRGWLGGEVGHGGQLEAPTVADFGPPTGMVEPHKAPGRVHLEAVEPWR